MTPRIPGCPDCGVPDGTDPYCMGTGHTPSGTPRNRPRPRHDDLSDPWSLASRVKRMWEDPIACARIDKIERRLDHEARVYRKQEQRMQRGHDSGAWAWALAGREK